MKILLSKLTNIYIYLKIILKYKTFKFLKKFTSEHKKILLLNKEQISFLKVNRYDLIKDIINFYTEDNKNICDDIIKIIFNDYNKYKNKDFDIKYRYKDISFNIDGIVIKRLIFKYDIIYINNIKIF